MKQAFLDRMKTLLQEEYPAYIKTLEERRYRGMRVNTCKIDQDVLQSLYEGCIRQTPFCPDSFYIEDEVNHIGYHPLHASGAIYLQEPSASSAVELLHVQPNDWVLDLCAAPGGKSTQIAAKLAHSGCLIANEIDAKRSQILMSNLERLGFGEVIVTNAHPDSLCEHCAGWFDKILVDAPCSGEGMMKKHDEAADGWSEEHVRACGNRQVQILDRAFDALKEGGTLVYSTCTYAIEENEQVVARILALRDDIAQIDCEASFGRPGVTMEGMDAGKVCRIFPMDQGEGHFIAKFKKIQGGQTNRIKEKKKISLPKEIQAQLEDIVAFPNGYWDVIQDKVYYRIQPFIDMGKIRVLRQGILCGEIIKNRLEPHQHLFMSSYLGKYLKRVCALDEDAWLQFQRGEQLPIHGYRGYTALAWHSLVVGFGKGDGTVIKNKYPKGLRRK